MLNEALVNFKTEEPLFDLNTMCSILHDFS